MAGHIDDGVTKDSPDHRASTDRDALQAAGDHGDPHSTTEHLRQLWLAGGRDITVTYDDGVVRHRSYLTHPH